MDWDSCAELENLNKALNWFRKFRECRGEPLTSWVSSFHQYHLPCRLANEDIAKEKRGSFNWTCKVIFTNGEAWMVRFPIDGKVKNPDEKVEIEVATIKVIRENTDIPVPEVKAWGLASENKLELGPFIITSFIEGVSLADFLRDQNDQESRMLREDVDDVDIQTIYKQIAHFMLQLSRLNFPRIGSLSNESHKDDGTNFAATISSRPMTWKAHEILNVGGVNVFSPANTTFSSTAEYLQHVAEQDWRHLNEQLNSVDNEEDARLKYTFWRVFQKLVPRFVSHDYDRGPFKLICDDFGPSNMMVNNTKDLKIVAVFDWEWSYAGPYQLFCCPPRWLVFDRPNQWAYEDERLQRYIKYLDILIQALEKEEVDTSQDVAPMEERLSTMMKGQKGGQMWFHHIIWEGFNGPTCVPFQKLRAAVPDFDELAAAIPEEEIDEFVKTKMQHLIDYKNKLDAYGDAAKCLR
ncbi:hypothetical protein BLS_008454 [Venturia inaequalis]|uniref:Aminoglycoside phosphotransferase domain-containing protein n=1 Tax=Venturia inaequalis TaxID=5025 RepID=A0A8H3UPH9_VENIN|nr:hypothetical protein BLS_008454 [Venturia inaequalis]KAE9973288.1 hypothetical protein EG328_004467 [Venturia inaequalis]KAE9992008.1 hypothetical protein EG327_010399 [Venturia inaequalis]RDI81388.1 hypothetical protein Vi05172_g8712 [Venturia inaequalis]